MTHPHDFSLLNDLLDGRMGWSAAEELRRRLVEEPELGLAYEELVRLREGLRALPRRAPPPDFLAGVRARAGLPPSVEATAPPAAPAGAAAGLSGGVGELGSAGRVIRLRRRFLPWATAAGLLVGLGAFALWRVRELGDSMPPTSSADGRRRDGTVVIGESKSPGRARPDAGAVSPQDAAEDRATGATRPRFGAPGGSVPPGLRTPADDPAPPPEAAREAPPAVRESEAGAGAEGPSGPGPAAPSIDADAPRASGSRGSPPPAARGSVPAIGGGGGGDADGLARAEADDEAAGRRAAGSTSATGESALGWARTGADDVLVLRAAGLDAARADVTVLLAAIRSGSARGGLPGALEHLKGDRDAGGKGADLASVDDARARGAEPGKPTEPPTPESEGATGEGEKRKTSVAAPPLGTFVIEVTEAEWARLLGAFEPAAGARKGASVLVPPPAALPVAPPARPAPAAPPAPPPAAPSIPGAAPPPPPEATPPAPPAGSEARPSAEGLDAEKPARADAPRRVVRIVVLPR